MPPTGEEVKFVEVRWIQPHFTVSALSHCDWRECPERLAEQAQGLTPIGWRIPDGEHWTTCTRWRTPYIEQRAPNGEI